MNYQFPYIENISDILPYVVSNRGINILDKKWFDCLCYNVISVFDESHDETLQMLRECRGIAFDKETGHIIARPPHKFFNVNEKEETQVHALSDDYEILEKVDGSLVFPIYNFEYDAFRLSTKRGITDTSMHCESYIARHTESRKFFNLFREFWNIGFTPYFEYVSPSNGVVVDYSGETKLVLLGARSLTTGEYMPYYNVKEIGDSHAVEVVKKFTFQKLMDIVEDNKSLELVEGYVLSFPNGHKVKAKTDWYVARSKIYDDVYEDYRLANLVLSGTADDVKSYTPIHKRRIENMEKFLKEFTTKFFDEVDRKLTIYGNDPLAIANEYSKHFNELEIVVTLAKINGKDVDRTYWTMMKKHFLSGRKKFTKLVDNSKNWYNIVYETVV